MDTKQLRLGLAVIILGIGALLARTAEAFPCDYGFVGPNADGSDAYACEDGPAGDNNDWSDPGLVFGADDWEPITKIDFGGARDEPHDEDFQSVFTTAFNGTWSFDPDLWDEFAQVMIVLKDGNVGDVFWSAYLVRPEDAAGFWDMGTECPAAPGCATTIPREISHISLYARGAVPEPGIISLLGAGLLGLNRFRKSRA
jgi:hypothetical protein